MAEKIHTWMDKLKRLLLIVENQRKCDEQILAGPMKGQFFKYAESMFCFYKRHAKMRGFCVLKRILSSSYAPFVCDKSRKSTNQKHTKRIGCEARVNAVRKRDGSWMVTKVCRDHIHQVDSSLSRHMAGRKFISKSVKKILEANDRASLRPYKSESQKWNDANPLLVHFQTLQTSEEPFILLIPTSSKST
ncbi:hypothetical protein RND71_004104 [Anisodus tanguticus]|uniref:FAR1 domain-containing protein n=1 Tax=Anisodus tanguticus TaxID=243964 RepID=A0AAE1SY13_9SOLA|nr:hypothetical protein RND71_004104 [Anisodus tanguticus]